MGDFIARWIRVVVVIWLIGTALQACGAMLIFF